jgi:hypothetical protein
MKELLILLGIAFVLVVVWNLLCYWVERRCIPEVKHYSELKALVPKKGTKAPKKGTKAPKKVTKRKSSGKLPKVRK